MQAIDAGALVDSCHSVRHADTKSSCDYDNQQQPTEIDNATITGGRSWKHRFACARLQPLNYFRAAPYPEMAATGSYVSAVVDPRPRVSTPRPPPLCPRYLNWRTEDKRDRSCQSSQSGCQDDHRLYASHLPDHTPQLCCGPCLHPQT